MAGLQIHISPPRVDSSKGPNRVNRAHRPTKENRQHFGIFWIFSVHGKIASDGPKWGQEDFFPTNPDLADILGDMDFDFENFYFLDFLGPKFPAWAHPLGPGLGPPTWARLGPLGWAGGAPRVGRVGPSGMWF